MLGEPEGSSESNLVEGENAGKVTVPTMTEASSAGHGSSLAKDEKPKSFRPPHRNRKGIPRRAPFF
jgi:hypothetical protein